MKELLTKRRALELCREIWQWCVDNPDKNKICCPSLRDVAGRSYFEHDCPCCEFVCQKIPSERTEGMSCVLGENLTTLSMCPLYKLWSEGCLCKGPFCSYSKGGDKKQAAMQIVEACNVELAAMDKEKK